MRWPLTVFGFIASAASAQTATTNCYSDSLGNTRCTTNSGNADHTIQDFVNSYARSSNEANQAQIKAMELHREQQVVAEAAEETKSAARMIIAGDCVGAERYALGKGNLELAREVKDYCGK